MFKKILLWIGIFVSLSSLVYGGTLTINDTFENTTLTQGFWDTDTGEESTDFAHTPSNSYLLTHDGGVDELANSTMTFTGGTTPIVLDFWIHPEAGWDSTIVMTFYLNDVSGGEGGGRCLNSYVSGVWKVYDGSVYQIVTGSELKDQWQNWRVHYYESNGSCDFWINGTHTFQMNRCYYQCQTNLVEIELITTNAAYDLYFDDIAVCDGECPAPPPPPVISSIDLIFRDESGNEKTNYNESENFFVYINYTLSNGTIVDDSLGICNVTVVDGILEKEANNSNFTLCNFGCDIDTNFTREFDMETIINSVEDSVHFFGCHEQTASGDIDLYIQCGAISDTITVDAVEMPLCSEGTAFIRKTFTFCNNSRYINVSNIADIPNSQRKRLLDGGVDREFNFHLFSDYSNHIFFNSSLNLWRINHSIEYYEHGIKSIFGNCSYIGDVTLDNNVAETITIVNVPPVIIFNGITTNLDFTLNAEPLIIEYSHGVWNWSGVVLDDDLLHFNVTWYNSSNVVMQTNTSLLNNTLLKTANELFVDFQNPYNITVVAVDVLGNTTHLNVQFNITDTGFPTFIGFVNKSKPNGTSHDWNETLLDEYLWEFNIICDNGFNFSISSIANTKYIFVNNSGVLTKSMTCQFNISDGHTAKIIPTFLTSNTVDTFTVGDLIIGIDGMKSITFQKRTDRYSYTITKDKSTKELVFTLPENCIYAENSRYRSHFICGNYWFDLEGIEEDIIIDKNFRIIRVSSEGKTELTFNSIGILNTVSGTQVISIFLEEIIPSVTPFNASRLNITIATSIFLLVLFIIGVAILTYGEIVVNIPIILISSLYFMLYGLYIVAIVWQFAIIIMLISFGIGIRAIDVLHRIENS